MIADISGIFKFELLRDNTLWRFGLVLAGIIVTLAIGKILQFLIDRFVEIHKKRSDQEGLSMFLGSLRKPLLLGVFAVGFYLCRNFLNWDNPDTETLEGIRPEVLRGWIGAAKIMGAFAAAWALNCMVDVIEFFMNRAAAKTTTKMDDMLVPVIKKAMRITILIVAVLFIVDMLVGLENIKSLLVGAGVGGIAVALAAKDVISNFFGSITIFADRPFQINDIVQYDGYLGSVEEVGFRSTRIRTLEGHQVTVPNEKMVTSTIENLGRLPSIRRTSNITITYDSGAEKTEKAVQIIKDILKNIPEINSESQKPPRVYFDEFNDCSLNIFMVYWVCPADLWSFKEVNQRVNLEMIRRFDEAGIEFAFPTQTLYIKKEGEMVKS